MKTTVSIPTKFCTVIKTTKCSAWVVQLRSSQIQDGGRPPSWRNRKMVISQQRFDRSSRNLAECRILAVSSLPTPNISTFWKSKMAAAAILKNRKMAISQQRFGRSPRNLAQWCILAIPSLPAPKISTFSKSKMPAAAILTLPYLTCRVGAYSSQRWGHIAGPIAQPHTNPKVKIFLKLLRTSVSEPSGFLWDPVDSVDMFPVGHFCIA